MYAVAARLARRSDSMGPNPRRRMKVVLGLFSFLLLVYMRCKNIYKADLKKFKLEFKKNDTSIAKIYLNDAIAKTNLNENVDLEERLLWFQEQRQRNITAEEEPLRLVYRTMAGLGHQLTRLAGVYHLSKIYKIPRIYVTANPVCGGDTSTIYDHLIGQGPLIVDLPFTALDEVKKPSLFPNYTIVDPSTMSNESFSSLRCCAYISNDVPGYCAPMKTVDEKGVHQNELYINLLTEEFYGKESSDYELYQQLMMLFKDRYQERIQKTLIDIKFDEHTVFALHIRTGNGEKGDFAVKHRGIKNVDKWVNDVTNLLCRYSETYKEFFVHKPLMLFVGADSASVIKKIYNASFATCRIPVVSAPQEYPEESKGVSFAIKYDDTEKCLKSWENMFLDMYIFTLCNTVIAGQYSSFTQSAPLSYIFQKSKNKPDLNSTHPHYYCEIAKGGDALECFDNLKGWMLRKKKMMFGNRTFERQDRLVEVLFPLLKLGGNKRYLAIEKSFAGTALRPMNRSDDDF